MAARSISSSIERELPDDSQLRTALSLTAFRVEWEEAAQRKSLLEIQAPVGLLLADLVDRLTLDEPTQASILGNRLYREVQRVLSRPG